MTGRSTSSPARRRSATTTTSRVSATGCSIWIWVRSRSPSRRPRRRRISVPSIDVLAEQGTRRSRPRGCVTGTSTGPPTSCRPVLTAQRRITMKRLAPSWHRSVLCRCILRLPARAQWVVFDPAQLLQTTLTALRTLSRSKTRSSSCRTKRRCWRTRPRTQGSEFNSLAPSPGDARDHESAARPGARIEFHARRSQQAVRAASIPQPIAAR